jgi:hypothetical protein
MAPSEPAAIYRELVLALQKQRDLQKSGAPVQEGAMAAWGPEAPMGQQSELYEQQDDAASNTVLFTFPMTSGTVPAARCARRIPPLRARVKKPRTLHMQRVHVRGPVPTLVQTPWVLPFEAEAWIP